MQVEISTKITIDGVSTEFMYKVEDGKDKDLRDLVQVALTKLAGKLQNVINEKIG